MYKNVKVDYEKLGNEIRERRVNLCITQEQLAEKSELSPTHISNIENGKVSVKLESLISICAVLNVGIDELLSNNTFNNSEIRFNGMMRLLSSCSDKELNIIFDVIKVLMKTIRKNC